MLAAPHLVLAHAGGDNGVAFGELVQLGDGVLGEDDLILFAFELGLDVVGGHFLAGDFVAQRGALFPLGDLLMPAFVTGLDGAGLDHLHQLAQRVFHIAVDGQLDFAIFVVLGTVEVHVDDGAVLAKFFDLAGHAIIEAHAKGEQ